MLIAIIILALVAGFFWGYGKGTSDENKRMTRLRAKEGVRRDA